MATNKILKTGHGEKNGTHEICISNIKSNIRTKAPALCEIKHSFINCKVTVYD